jgi:ATP-dependent DNA helicase RecG
MIKTLKELKKAIKFGESDRIELKSSFSKECFETVVAFANAGGGDIIIGVGKSGNIVGIQAGDETYQEWINQVKTSTSPSLIPDVADFKMDEKKIAVISVPEFPIKPVSLKGRYYLRIRNSNYLMSATEISNTHLKTFNTSWDFYPDEMHGVGDISIAKINQFIKQANKFREQKIGDKPYSVLRKYEMLKGGSGQISKAAFLLFMKDESMLSGIELGRFSDPTSIRDALTLKTDLFTEVEGA